MGRRLMKIAGSPLGQPSLSPASGILLSHIFFVIHENNGTGLRRRVAREGRKIAPKSGGQRKGRDGWMDIGDERWEDWTSFGNDRIWLGLREGTGESGGLFWKELWVCVCVCVREGAYSQNDFKWLLL